MRPLSRATPMHVSRKGARSNVCELVGAKHRTHQANVVVIRSAEQQVTYFVRQHASQRASKIVVEHDPAGRGAAYLSKRQHALGGVERHANRSRARGIPLDGRQAHDRAPTSAGQARQ